MVLVGNPWSASRRPRSLPQPIGGIGQLLPPGAGGNLLRSTAFFGGAGSGSHLVVLAAYAAVGLAALWAGALWRRRHAADAATGAARPMTTTMQRWLEALDAAQQAVQVAASLVCSHPTRRQAPADG